eukprot:1349776-Amorphochlora_amoeboformis.AAC.1
MASVSRCVQVLVITSAYTRGFKNSLQGYHRRDLYPSPHPSTPTMATSSYGTSRIRKRDANSREIWGGGGRTKSRKWAVYGSLFTASILVISAATAYAYGVGFPHKGERGMTTLEGSQGVLSEKQMPMKLRYRDSLFDFNALPPCYFFYFVFGSG